MEGMTLIVVCHSSFVEEDQMYLGLPAEICDYFGGPDEMISGPPIQDSKSQTSISELIRGSYPSMRHFPFKNE